MAKFNPALSGAASLVYSTYLGGSGVDGRYLLSLTKPNSLPAFFGMEGPGIALDSAGSAYVTGYTKSANFPVTAGAYKTNSGIASNTGGLAFVTKLNAAGSGLVYSTFLGTVVKVSGNTPNYAWARDTVASHIAVDAAGNAHVTGMTASNKFPMQNPIDNTFGGLGDAYVTKLNATGSSLLFSTYLGGQASDVGMGIELDASNNIYVAGITYSDDFPVTPGAFQTTKGFTGAVGFATKVSL